MAAKEINIMDYSELSIIVIGDTRPIKDELKEIPGSYNPRLTHPDTGKRVAGWVFSKRNTAKVIDTCTKLHHSKLVGKMTVTEKLTA